MRMIPVLPIEGQPHRREVLGVVEYDAEFIHARAGHVTTIGVDNFFRPATRDLPEGWNSRRIRGYSLNGGRRVAIHMEDGIILACQPDELDRALARLNYERA